MGWSERDIPSLEGRQAIVTGANVGLGLQTATALARAGATVILASRDEAKAADALVKIRTEVPGADVEAVPLDLASLASIQRFSDTVGSVLTGGLDLLINNAGVMMPPRRETVDGFELQLGTNHLGHFALTGRLLPKMNDREGTRIVTVSSAMARLGRIDFEDLQGSESYSRTGAYAQSKLANLIFSIELDRRLRASGSAIRSMGAHPGYAATNLQAAGPRIGGGFRSAVAAPFMALGHRLFAQSAAAGSLPALRAATDPGLPGGTYVGPNGPGEMRGSPVTVTPVASATDPEVAERLWEASVGLTEVEYPLDPA